jgi:hypothetical protein
VVNVFLTWGPEQEPVASRAATALTRFLYSLEIAEQLYEPIQIRDVGDSRAESTATTIRESSLVVAFLSESWALPYDPPRGHRYGDKPVYDNVKSALSSSVPILPVLLGSYRTLVNLPEDVAALSRIQAARLPGRKPEAEIAELGHTVISLLSEQRIRYAPREEDLNVDSEQIRATYVPPSSAEGLTLRLRVSQVCVLVGEAGMGLESSAIMALSSFASEVREFIVGPELQFADLATIQLTEGVGYFVQSNGPITADDLAEISKAFVAGHAYLVIIRDHLDERLPSKFVVEQTLPDPLAVIASHITYLTRSDPAEIRDRALAYADRSGVRSLLHDRMPDQVAAAALSVVDAIRAGTEPMLALANPATAQHNSLPPGRPEPRLTSDTWTTDDALGHRQYADAIVTFIRHPDTRPPLTIGISGAWGAGKTSLMRMIQERLDPPENRDTWTKPEIQLSRKSRERLTAPRSDDTAQRRITIGELLRRAWHRSTADDTDLRDLDVTPPGGLEQQWRPTVWFNPWMYQSGEQVWAGLAHEIITQVTRRMAAGDRERFWLKLNLRRIDRQAVRRKVYQVLLEKLLPLAVWLVAFLLVLGTALLMSWLIPVWRELLHYVVGVVTPVGTVGTILVALWQGRRFLGQEAVTQFRSLVTEPSMPVATRRFVADQARDAPDKLVVDPGYRDRLGFLHLVQTDMRHVLDLVATPDRPLVVFVDDLDRCSPGTVAQVIEAINLFLAGEFPNCVFVLAVEPSVIAAHIEATYPDLATNLHVDGDSTLGWRFMAKIVQLPLSLPPSGENDQTYLDSLLPPPPLPPSTPVPFESPIPEPVPPQPAPSPVPAHWATAVDAIEAAIRRRSPTIENLPEVCRLAQQDVMGPNMVGLLAETVEARDRVFADLYSDADSREPIASAINAAGIRNPREIKRFINLYRFYTFIGQQAAFYGREQIEPEVVTKIVTLALRWPHLLTNLRTRSTTEDGATILHLLEQHVRVPAEVSGDGQALGWCPADLAGHAELHRFLASGPAIAQVARLLI